MIKLNLDEYKHSSQYMYLFDAIIKEKIIINKDAFLISQEIAPTSYRRARNSEQKVGEEILKNLSKYFGLRLVDESFIVKLEKLTNNIFFDVNYKVFEKYDKHLNLIEDLLSKNLIVYPILKLLRLFLRIFSNGNIAKLKEENKEEFLQIQKYYNFFNDSLREIYDLLILVYSNSFTKEMLAKKYSNGISYSIIAVNYRRQKEYYKSLYFAQKAKDIFIDENNYKRAIYMNYTILNDLASTLNFDDYYDLAHNQYLVVRAFNTSEVDKINCQKHMVCACIAKQKYDEVFDLLEDRQKMTLTELSCYVIAGYNTFGKNFKKWYTENISQSISIKEFKDLIEKLVDYLNEPEKRKLQVFYNTEMMESLIDILANY